MAFDPGRILAADVPDTDGRWAPDDVILYQLGIGAGKDPIDPSELAYVYEPVLKVLPAFASIPMFPSLAASLSIDGMDVNPLMILHGEHAIEVPGPIPSAGTVTNRTRAIGVHDKGKGALVRLVVESVDESGSTLFTNTVGLFVRGEGGFGGDSGPDPSVAVPDREPDVVIESSTFPQQALLYRLSGDRNPLHADPAVAAFAGFDRPILHGLCSYGIVCKAVVDAALGGDVTAVRAYEARFSGVVFPGETIVTRAWDEGDRWLAEAHVAGRGTPVVTRAMISVADRVRS